MRHQYVESSTIAESSEVFDDSELPTAFRDSLSLRAKNLRFRGVGNPYAFLNGIGITPIKEFICRGATILDLADTLNLPITIIRDWVEHNNLEQDLQEAAVISAEGYIHQGEELLRHARSPFELARAKTMLEHGKFMASKKDKITYGTNQVDPSAAASVSYVFNISNNAPVQINTDSHKPDPNSYINKEEVSPTSIVLDVSDSPIDLGRMPAHVFKTHSTFPTIAPVKNPDGE